MEFGRIQLPAGHHPNDIEKEWGKLIVAMLEREKSLRPEVERWVEAVCPLRPSSCVYLSVVKRLVPASFSELPSLKVFNDAYWSIVYLCLVEIVNGAPITYIFFIQ